MKPVNTCKPIEHTTWSAPRRVPPALRVRVIICYHYNDRLQSLASLLSVQQTGARHPGAKREVSANR